MKKLLLIAASVLLLSACSKKGEPGTANVIYSKWFKPATYTKDTVFGIWGFKHNQPVPEITQQVLDTAAILTFARLEGYNPLVWPTGQVGQLSITVTYMQGGVTNDTWTAQYTPGNLRIRFQNDRNIYTTIANGHSFRYIIIPGARLGRQAPMTYEEVCRKYNIPE
jgi:hypothetical protein